MGFKKTGKSPVIGPALTESELNQRRANPPVIKNVEAVCSKCGSQTHATSFCK